MKIERILATAAITAVLVLPSTAAADTSAAAATIAPCYAGETLGECAERVVRSLDEPGPIIDPDVDDALQVVGDGITIFENTVEQIRETVCGPVPPEICSRA